MALRSKPLLHSSAPASGVVVENVKRTTTGSHKVELRYNVSAAGGQPPAPEGPFQKVYVQTCRFKRAFLKSWNNNAPGGTGAQAAAGGQQTPIHEVIRQLADPNTQGVKLDLMVSLQGEDDKGNDVNNFVKGFYEPLEQHVLDVAKKRCESWFRKALAPEVIESHFTSAIKPSSDPSKYARLMKFNVPFRYGKLECDVFDANRQAVSLGDFADNVRGAEVVLIIEIPHVCSCPSPSASPPPSAPSSSSRRTSWPATASSPTPQTHPPQRSPGCR